MGSDSQNAIGLSAALLQISSLGLVWIFLHCSSMCGPIVTGLRLGDGRNAIHPFWGLLSYQLGRALVYSVLGGLAGFFGSRVVAHPLFNWVPAVILGILVVVQISPQILSWFSTPRILIRFSTQLSAKTGFVRALLFGVLFAFLPCMLVFWALTIAATTGTLVGGVLVMLFLVVLTTLPLMTVSLSLNQFFRKFQKRVSLVLLILSFIWTLMVTFAANDLISHQHLSFEVLGNSYTLMFW